MKTNDKIFTEFNEVIQYFIDHKDNEPNTEFCNNVDRLINLQANLVNGIETREDKCTLHIVSNNEANNICPDCHKPKRMMNNTLQLLCECESEVAVKGCHNCKNNPHAPFVPKICDSCYAPGLNNWQPLTDC